MKSTLLIWSEHILIHQEEESKVHNSLKKDNFCEEDYIIIASFFFFFGGGTYLFHLSQQLCLFATIYLCSTGAWRCKLVTYGLD